MGDHWWQFLKDSLTSNCLPLIHGRLLQHLKVACSGQVDWTLLSTSNSNTKQHLGPMYGWETLKESFVSLH